MFKDIYSVEGVIFDFLTNQPTTDSGWTGGRRLGAAPGLQFRALGWQQVTQNSYSLEVAGETMRYLYGVITQNTRPSSWISRAKVKLRELADWMISGQTGFGVSATLTKSNAIGYGQVFSAIGTLTADQGRCGLGLLYAYLVLGDVKYLASARAVADYLTNMQSGGLLSSGFDPSSTDAAGANPINYGTWTRTALSSGNAFDHVYQPDSLVCLEFLKRLYDVVGDELHGADTTITGQFTQVPQQLLSVSMANARAFWATGCFDAVVGSTVNGFTITTPREFFNSFPTTKLAGAAGTGSWQYQNGPSATGTLLTAYNYAVALRALYAYEGYSATVAALWSWLMGFTSNHAFQPTTTSLAQDAPTVLSNNGTYNPKLCLSGLLQVRATGTLATVAMNGSGTYDVRCAGALAAIQGSQDPGSLDTAKDFFSTGRQTNAIDYDRGIGSSTTYLMMQLNCGLSGQASGASVTTPITWDARAAAVFGQAFRYGNVVTPTVQV